jgi:hypothetical protein
MVSIRACIVVLTARRNDGLDQVRRPPCLALPAHGQPEESIALSADLTISLPGHDHIEVQAEHGKDGRPDRPPERLHKLVEAQSRQPAPFGSPARCPWYVEHATSSLCWWFVRPRSGCEIPRPGYPLCWPRHDAWAFFFRQPSSHRPACRSAAHPDHASWPGCPR